MDIDLPATVAEVARAFVDYERALVEGDVAAMSDVFWTDERVVRFGLSDHQYGAAELRQWRADQPPLPAGRRLTGTRISTFGTDFAVVTTRFSYPNHPEGRQSQSWARIDGRWRIVGAHVSVPARTRVGSER